MVRHWSALLDLLGLSLKTLVLVLATRLQGVSPYIFVQVRISLGVTVSDTPEVTACMCCAACMFAQHISPAAQDVFIVSLRAQLFFMFHSGNLVFSSR